MRPFMLTVVALTLVSSLAFAGGDKDKDKDKDKGQGQPAAAAAPAASAGAAASANAADDDDEPAAAPDGGKAVGGRRTPAQLALRKQIWERREKAVEAKVHKGGKHLTDEERDAIKKHWHKVSRLMRIRELAQEDKNDAAVKRADAALEREEKGFDAKLEKLNAKAAGGAK